MNSEEAEQLKKQLLNNVDASLPEEKAAVLKRQIMSMSNEQLQHFMNNPIKSECIFCSISSGRIKSYKIGENNDAIAVLEINPISKGHIIIIPKEHISVENIPEDIHNFAKAIANQVKEKLSPKDIELASADFQDHGIINIIPIYNEENIHSKRYKASKEELDEVLKILTSKEETKKPKERRVRKKVTSSKKIWLPKRIP